METALVGFKEKLQKALPTGRNVDQEISSILATVASTPALQKCAPQSIALAAYQAASVGLPVNVLGLAYLVPYGNEAKFQAGYKGLLHLLYETGFVDSVDAEAVHENDKFDFTLGSKPTINHSYKLTNRGNFKAVYAIAHLRNGITKQVILSKEDVDRIRQLSKSGNSGPWVTHYAEMAKKTAIRRLAKYLPQYVQGLNRVQRAIELEEKQFEITSEPSRTPTYYQEDSEPESTEPLEEVLAEVVDEALEERQKLISKIRDLQTAIKEKDSKVEKLPDLEKLNFDELNLLLARKEKHWDLCK